jgi:hypothetical protein
MDKYEILKAYIQGKISEMFDCEECNLTEHQANHLLDIENYISELDENVKYKSSTTNSR